MFKNKTLLALNIFLTLAILSIDICFIMLGRAYIFKTLASVLFVFCGMINFVFILKSKEERNKMFKYFMLTGLVFACLGDILLIDFFIVGAIFFAIGHVFFFVAYSVLHKLNWRDLILSLIIFGISLIVVFVPKIFDFIGMLPIVVVYALIISFMLGKSISNFFENKYKIENLIIMVGSILFFLSDLMLLFNVFSNISNVFDILCLSLYYPAEIMLAVSIYYSNLRRE